eukprot:scaffold38969_cov14-Prasinocladus_malaysianus.AAC.3
MSVHEEVRWHVNRDGGGLDYVEPRKAYKEELKAEAFDQTSFSMLLDDLKILLIDAISPKN